MGWLYSASIDSMSLTRPEVTAAVGVWKTFPINVGFASGGEPIIAVYVGVVSALITARAVQVTPVLQGCSTKRPCWS